MVEALRASAKFLEKELNMCRESTTVVAVLCLGLAWNLGAGQSDSLTFKDGKKAAAGLEVLAYTPDGPKPLGKTDAGGVLAGIDPSFFTMKPHGSDVIVQECDGETKTYLNFSEASDDGVCKSLSESGSERKCKCKALGLWIWGKDVQIGSTFPILYVVGGGAAGALVAIVASGGSDASSVTTPTSSPVPSAGSPTPSAETSFMRTYQITITRIVDPAGHLEFSGQPPPQLKVTVNGGNILIEGADPWVPVTGSYNPSTGAFSAAGMGTIAGRPNVRATFEGTLSNGTIRGTVVWGANGGLPNSPIQFEIEGSETP